MQCIHRHHKIVQSNNWYHETQQNIDQESTRPIHIIPLSINRIQNPYAFGCSPGQSIQQWINAQNANQSGHLLLESSTIIPSKYGEKLHELIKTLQDSIYNYIYLKVIHCASMESYQSK